MSEFFNTNDPIFQNEDVLRDDWQPEQIQERDNEIDAYRNALKPVVLGRQPRNIFLYGKTGTGKTAVTEFIMDKLADESKDFDFDINIYLVNCNALNSSYQVAAKLINEMRPPDEQINQTGYPREKVFQMLYNEIEACGGTVLFVLDEVENITPDDDILYEIPRARSNGHIENARPGIIGISNDLKLQEEFSPKVLDTLFEEELQFEPYDAGQLIQILDERKEKAFKTGVLDDDVIPLCSALAAQDTGSARQALSLLLKAGDRARVDDSDVVEERHVRAAESALKKEQVKEGMRNLTRHGKIVLVTLLKLEAMGETPVRTSTIQEAYEKTCRTEFDKDPLADRAFYNHLSDLDMLGIAEGNLKNLGNRGGRYQEYTLDVPLEDALAALEDELWEFPEIRKQAGISTQQDLDDFDTLL